MPASFTRTVNCEVDMQFLMRGNFYEFEFGRVVSRPGQPLAIRQDIEIGREIPRELAFTRVRNGGNVYTVGKEDAFRLAKSVTGVDPVEDDPHNPQGPSPTGRMNVYFRHLHPGGDHEAYGHIFFGERGENYGEEN